MSEYMHLIGTEQVQNAACLMNEAADKMQRAAASFEDTLYRYSQRVEEWLGRLETALQEGKS